MPNAPSSRRSMRWQRQDKFRAKTCPKRSKTWTLIRKRDLRIACEIVWQKPLRRFLLGKFIGTRVKRLGTQKRTPLSARTRHGLTGAGTGSYLLPEVGTRRCGAPAPFRRGARVGLRACLSARCTRAGTSQRDVPIRSKTGDEGSATLSAPGSSARLVTALVLQCC